MNYRITRTNGTLLVILLIMSLSGVMTFQVSATTDPVGIAPYNTMWGLGDLYGENGFYSQMRYEQIVEGGYPVFVGPASPDLVADTSANFKLVDTDNQFARTTGIDRLKFQTTFTTDPEKIWYQDYADHDEAYRWVPNSVTVYLKVTDPDGNVLDWDFEEQGVSWQATYRDVNIWNLLPETTDPWGQVYSPIEYAPEAEPYLEPLPPEDQDSVIQDLFETGARFLWDQVAIPYKNALELSIEQLKLYVENKYIPATDPSFEYGSEDGYQFIKLNLPDRGYVDQELTRYGFNTVNLAVPIGVDINVPGNFKIFSKVKYETQVVHAEVRNGAHWTRWHEQGAENIKETEVLEQTIEISAGQNMENFRTGRLDIVNDGSVNVQVHEDGNNLFKSWKSIKGQTETWFDWFGSTGKITLTPQASGNLPFEEWQNLNGEPLTAGDGISFNGDILIIEGGMDGGQFPADDLLYVFVAKFAEPDTTKPQISPAFSNGDSVENTFVVSATATDNIAVSDFDLYINGAHRSATVTGSSEKQLSYAWNTKNSQNGNHEIKLVAIDSAGNVKENIYTLRVDNDLDINQGSSSQTHYQNIYGTHYAKLRLFWWQPQDGDIIVKLYKGSSSTNINSYVSSQSYSGSFENNYRSFYFGVSSTGYYKFRVLFDGQTYFLNGYAYIYIPSGGPGGPGGPM